MGILNLKKRVNCDKCSFTTKQRMFGVFAIDEIGEPGSSVRALYATLNCVNSVKSLVLLAMVSLLENVVIWKMIVLVLVLA